MADYRISFYKNLVSSNGRRFKCLQAEFDITGSVGPVQAVDAASHKFELRHGSRDWRFYADIVEIADVNTTRRADARSPVAA